MIGLPSVVGADRNEALPLPAPGPQRRPEPAGRPDGGVLRLDLRIPVPATRGHDQSSQNQSSQPDGADQDGWQIAVTVCLPAQPSPSAAGPGTDGLETGGLEPGGSAAGGSGPGVPVLVGLPGGGYARRYFDLPEPGYSQAEHHVHRGAVVVMVDHLGVGESSVPPTEVTDLPTVAWRTCTISPAPGTCCGTGWTPSPPR
ncbi:hypothetical protein [Parafrankia soli]|uniref:hypothetical protein n=1 Tax=Parafrankia soli TaxID=2599596 RepID=UPI0008D9AF00|nr:hypothetical protein [Parafrankia soli]